MYVD
jgi:translation elongation factor EF-1alpha